MPDFAYDSPHFRLRGDLKRVGFAPLPKEIMPGMTAAFAAIEMDYAEWEMMYNAYRDWHWRNKPLELAQEALDQTRYLLDRFGTWVQIISIIREPQTRCYVVRFRATRLDGKTYTFATREQANTIIDTLQNMVFEIQQGKRKAPEGDDNGTDPEREG